MAKTIVVYWATNTLLDRQTKINMMLEPPKPLVSMLPKSNGNKNGYRSCSAGKDFWKNTYAIINPADSYVKVSGETEKLVFDKNDGFWLAEPSGLINTYRVDYDFSWLFFSEKSVKVQQLPPFLHNTSAAKNGRISAGSFDISKWFRPINLTYLLWENSNELYLKKGEPLSYLQFLTDEKIVLKQFELTPELRDIMVQVVNWKAYYPHEPLHILYERFTRGNRHKRILKLIKENLLD